MNFQLVLLLVCNILFLTNKKSEAALKEGDCEVCIKEIDAFIKTLTPEMKYKEDVITEEYKKFCKKAKSKRERLCYYLGGLETSATNIVKQMSKPLSWGLPSEKICEKLKKLDSQICELKYDKTIDLAKTNLKKLKVKDLKKILSQWGEDQACKGCAEKSDFIKVIEELMPVYAPEAYASRQKAEL